MNIQLGQKVRDKTSNFIGIAYTLDKHCFGCETVFIMPEGFDDIEKGHEISTAVVEVIDDGILDKLGYVPAIKPMYEPGERVTTVMGCTGTITVRSLTLHNTFRYFISLDNEKTNDKREMIISFENLLKAAKD